MTEIKFIPTLRKRALSDNYCNAISAYLNIVDTLNYWGHPTTTEELKKILQIGGTYHQELAVAEAKQYAESAPKAIKEKMIREAFESINPEFITSLSSAISCWVHGFEVDDFENDKGELIIKAEVKERMEEEVAITLKGDKVEEVERLKKFIDEYHDIDMKYGISNLFRFAHNDTESIAEFVYHQ
ncbi:MAG: hypothetical protein SNI70_06105 [Rikenellaceae bacterium]